jgi:hypothetical protein
LHVGVAINAEFLQAIPDISLVKTLGIVADEDIDARVDEPLEPGEQEFLLVVEGMHFDTGNWVTCAENKDVPLHRGSIDEHRSDLNDGISCDTHAWKCRI